jgi:hypothetical protein
MLGPTVGLEKATIEDLIPRDIYMRTLGECGYKIKLNADEQKAATNVAAAEKAFERAGQGKFGSEHKAAAALKFIDFWGKDPKSIPDETRQRASTLFAAINARFND